MLLDSLILLAGGLMLYFGAEWLVRGAGALAYALGVRPLVVGLTVVSWGTSAPELVVSLLAALQGKSAIALGNVVGSNIANTGLILGVIALVAPPKTDGCMRNRELVFLIGATAAVPLLLLDGAINRLEGMLLLAAAVGFTLATVRWSRRRPAAPGYEVPEVVSTTTSKPVLVLLLVAGLTVLVAGGHAFVLGAVGLATAWGMSERVVGLTIVAIGTSLPELAASLVAALRGESDLAVGNVVGSNVYNLLLILGGTASITAITGNLATLWTDFAFLAGLTLIAVWSLRRSRVVTRAEGGLYVASYASFVALLAVQG